MLRDQTAGALLPCADAWPAFAGWLRHSSGLEPSRGLPVEVGGRPRVPGRRHKSGGRQRQGLAHGLDALEGPPVARPARRDAVAAVQGAADPLLEALERAAEVAVRQFRFVDGVEEEPSRRSPVHQPLGRSTLLLDRQRSARSVPVGIFQREEGELAARAGARRAPSSRASSPNRPLPTGSRVGGGAPPASHQPAGTRRPRATRGVPVRRTRLLRDRGSGADDLRRRSAKPPRTATASCVHGAAPGAG
jgi:hypothetical protein